LKRVLIKSEPDCDTSLDLLWGSLADALTFAARQKDLAQPTWRRDSLRPNLLLRDRFAVVGHALTLRVFPRGASRSTYDVVQAQRAEGRLLLSFPDLELSDGNGKALTGGFLDDF
jgi:hypothetical protein